MFHSLRRPVGSVFSPRQNEKEKIRWVGKDRVTERLSSGMSCVCVLLGRLSVLKGREGRLYGRGRRKREANNKKTIKYSIPVVFWVSYAFRIDIAPGQGVWRFFFSFSFFFSGGGWGEIFGVSGCTVASGESGAPG